MRETFDEKAKRVFDWLTREGNEKQCTRKKLEQAVRAELDLWRSDHISSFIKTLEAKGYIEWVGLGVAEIKPP